jgi:hypothetical protein
MVTKREWPDHLNMAGLKINVWATDLELYPWPAQWIFERSLHFVAQLGLSLAAEHGLH